MLREVRLREICHARTGDKSDTVTLSVIPYDPAHYAFLCEVLTADRVRKHFGQVIEGQVHRYEVPNIAALNFILERALDGGVARSLRPDPQGKVLSGPFLDMMISIPPEFVLPSRGPFGYEAASSPDTRTEISVQSQPGV